MKQRARLDLLGCKFKTRLGEKKRATRTPELLGVTRGGAEFQEGSGGKKLPTMKQIKALSHN